MKSPWGVEMTAQMNVKRFFFLFFFFLERQRNKFDREREPTGNLLMYYYTYSMSTARNLSELHRTAEGKKMEILVVLLTTLGPKRQRPKTENVGEGRRLQALQGTARHPVNN